MNKYINKNNQTNEKIETAILKLMNSKSLNKVTMSEIAAQAGINRVTLYRHFDDKWGIVEQIEQDFFTKITKPHNKMLNKLSVKSENGILYLTNFLKVFEQNLNTIKILLSDNGDLAFSNKLMTHLLQMEELSHPIMHLDISKDMQDLFSFYGISALIGIIRFWTLHPYYSAKEMATFFFKMRTGELSMID
ncbi:TetR/AcrR family transcriptional regulator [uncultured Lactobacillus sp.]|uniref:TetR/AcrR family transcriptional regulator n=1 Tax=uncultured Lactobacillus sp. TaxID=153152 RepID=UPI0026180E97|nr:TetR/AcrR family transcriptional regulator [uncultured Lactobacillus sp.]